jgi:cytochrome c peroxidase
LLIKNLGTIPAYQEQFRRIFGTDFQAVGVAQAIAAYERTILSGNSAYDRFNAGDKAAMSPSAQRGLVIFEGKARCVSCHAGFNFTDESFHNLGLGMNRENPDLGRQTVTQLDTDKGAFKTPTLRDVAVRGPYMHDGSLASLEDVVAFYNQGGSQNPWLSKEIRPLNLTGGEQVDLVAFLNALTGEIAAEVSRPPMLPQ